MRINKICLAGFLFFASIAPVLAQGAPNARALTVGTCGTQTFPLTDPSGRAAYAPLTQLQNGLLCTNATGGGGGGAAADQTGSNAADGQATSTANQHAITFLYLFNGSTYDRWRGTGGAANVSVQNFPANQPTTDANAAQTITTPGTAPAKSQSVQSSGGQLLSLDASTQAVKTALGNPFQAGGSIANTAFGINGSLPAFAATPTFNLGTAPTLTVQGTVGVTQSGGLQVSTTSSGGTTGPITTPASSLVGGLEYLSTPPTLANGQAIALQGDPSANLYVSLGRAGMTGPSVGTAAALGVVQQDGISDTVSASAVGPFTGGTADPTTGSEIMTGFQSFSVQFSAVGTSPVVFFEGSNLCTSTATDWQALEWKQIAGTGTYIGNTAVSVGGFYKFDVNYKCARIRLGSGSGTTTATIIRKTTPVFPVNTNVTPSVGTSQTNPLFASESAANLATSQATASTTATLICAARTGRRAVTIQNLGTTQVFYGPSTVTTTTGGLIPGTAGSAATLNTSAAIYGIVATGTQAVACTETY